METCQEDTETGLMDNWANPSIKTDGSTVTNKHHNSYLRKNHQ
jgi:hypothetical protein